MSTGTVNIKFLQNPLHNQNIAYTINKNGIGISTINKFFKAPNSIASSRMVRINQDSLTIDSTYNIGSGFNTSSLNRMVCAKQADGKLIVGGYFTTFNGITVNRIVRLKLDGSIDTTFVTGTGFNGGVEDIKIQSDGNIIVCGFFTNYNGVTKNRIVRLTSTGSVDASFNISTGFNYQADRIAIQLDGSIIVGGQFTTYRGSNARGLVRILTNGNFDSTFNVGTGTLISTSSYDTFDIKILSSGKILITGLFPTFNGTTVNGIARINSNGSLDTSFNVGGSGISGFSNLGRNLAIQSDGKIILVGRFSSYNGNSANGICRLEANGSFDSTFNVGGTGLNDNFAQYSAIQSDGSILVVGEFTSYNGNNVKNFVKIDTNGNYINDNQLQFNLLSNYIFIDSTKIYFLGDFSTITSLNQSTINDIPIGQTMFDTIQYSYENLVEFNSNSGITYSITGDTIQVEFDFDSLTEVLTMVDKLDVPFYVVITFDDGIDVPVGTLIFSDESITQMINPAYNNSIIKYYTTASNIQYSELDINGIVYKIYPFQNSFVYNFKEVAKNLINPNYFKDNTIPDIMNPIADDSTLSLTLNVGISVTDSNNESLNATKIIKFLKNVEQLPNYNQRLSINPSVRMLLPTSNYTDYYIPYFEGYPMDVSIFGIQTNDEFYLKNISNYNQSQTYTATTSEVKRIFISDGQNECSFIDDLNLASNQNKLELWNNNSFVCNLIIDKKESKCGVLLKWFNNSGSYSYWLFNGPKTTTDITKSLDDINGKYDNLQNVDSTSNIIGKKGERRLKLKTDYTKQEKEYLRSILLSPKVEMYSYNQPFSNPYNNQFYGVSVNDGSFNDNDKTSKNTLELNITLPDLFTQTL